MTDIIDLEKLQKSFVSHFKEALYLHDFNGQIIEVNNTAIHDTGYSRDELLKMNMCDITIQGEGQPVVMEKWKRIKPDEQFVFQAKHANKNDFH